MCPVATVAHRMSVPCGQLCDSIQHSLLNCIEFSVCIRTERQKEEMQRGKESVSERAKGREKEREEGTCHMEKEGNAYDMA